MGRLLDEAVTVDPTAGVHRLPQPFRMIDKILSGVVDDAAAGRVDRVLIGAETLEVWGADAKLYDAAMVPWLDVSWLAEKLRGSGVAFGAAAALVHPATGYQLCRMLAAAPKVADALITAHREKRTPDAAALLSARATGRFFARDAPCYYGEYALSFAVSTGQGSLVNTLLEAGADATAPTAVASGTNVPP